MKAYYNHPETQTRLGYDEREFTFEEVRDMVRSLRGSPDASLIATLPCGAGIDFKVYHDGLISIEFYADGLSLATVTPDIAEKFFVHAYPLQALANPKVTFSDLVCEWEY